MDRSCVFTERVTDFFKYFFVDEMNLGGGGEYIEGRGIGNEG